MRMKVLNSYPFIRRFSMKKLTVLNKSILTALCVALCVVLPMTLHAIPKGGVLFSPMHLPVLLCGLVLSPIHI